MTGRRHHAWRMTARRRGTDTFQSGTTQSGNGTAKSESGTDDFAAAPKKEGNRETCPQNARKSNLPSSGRTRAGSHSATPTRRTVRPPIVAQRDPPPSHSATLSYIDHLKIIPRIITRRPRRRKECRVSDHFPMSALVGALPSQKALLPERGQKAFRLTR